MVLCALFITWFPLTEAAVLSTEAESVGVYRAKTETELKLKIKIDKQNPNRKVKFLRKCTNKKLREKVIFDIPLFYHKQNQKLALKLLIKTLFH